MRDFILEILKNNKTIHAFSSKDLNIIFNAIKNYKSSKNELYILQLWDENGCINTIIKTNNIQQILNLDIYNILELYNQVIQS